MSASPDLAPFVYRRRVRWGDADPALIAYTVRFVDYAMEAVEEWYRAVLGTDWYRLTLDENSGAPVVHLGFDFHSPLRPGDEAHVAVRVDELRRATIAFALRGYRNGDRDALSFTGKIVGCFVDSGGKVMKSKTIPQHYRERILAYQRACKD